MSGYDNGNFCPNCGRGPQRSMSYEWHFLAAGLALGILVGIAAMLMLRVLITANRSEVAQVANGSSSAPVARIVVTTEPSATSPAAVSGTSDESPAMNSAGMPRNQDNLAVNAGSGLSMHEAKISIQTAATRICEAAGLKYAWQKSKDDTKDKSKLYISVDIENATLTQALNEIVIKHGLKYYIENGELRLSL